MKKFLTRILGMVVAFISVCYNFCYADIAISTRLKPTTSNSDILPMIIIGIVIIVLVVISIIILVKSENNKNEKNNNEE